MSDQPVDFLCHHILSFELCTNMSYYGTIIQDWSHQREWDSLSKKSWFGSNSHNDNTFKMALFHSVLTLDCCFLALLSLCFISTKKSNAPTTANPLMKLKSRRTNSVCPNKAGFVIAWSASYTTHNNSIIRQCSQAIHLVAFRFQ